MKKVYAVLEIPEGIDPKEVTVTASHHAYTISSVYGASEFPKEIAVDPEQNVTRTDFLNLGYGLGFNDALKKMKGEKK